MYFRVPLPSPSLHCPPSTHLSHGPFQRPPQPGQLLHAIFSALHYRRYLNKGQIQRTRSSLAADAAHQFSISIVKRYYPLPKVKGMVQHPLLTSVELNLYFALDYLIRWDYISNRGRAQSGSSCPIQIRIREASGVPALRKCV